jgi:hypothetical protein
MDFGRICVPSDSKFSMGKGREENSDKLAKGSSNWFMKEKDG